MRPPRPPRLPAKPRLLQKLLARKPGRVAVVGIGSDLRGDDAFGVLVARKLSAGCKHSPRLRAFDGGTAPENLTGEIIHFLTAAPRAKGLVLLADAAEMGLAPGRTRLLSPGRLAGASCFTHRLPLKVLADYLTGRSGCRVAVVAAEPRSIAFGARVSPEVARAAENVAAEIQARLAPLKQSK